MILEHILIGILYMLGVCYYVMRKINKLRTEHPELKRMEVFKTYWDEEWNTNIVSGLGFITVQVFLLIAHLKKIPLPEWLHEWGLYLGAIVAGYCFHWAIYAWLGTTEQAVAKKINGNSNSNP